MLSIVLPTFNEIRNGYIQKILPRITALPNVEVICVDFNSTDGTQELVKGYSAKLIISQYNSRAMRMNEGIKASAGKLILLHHPRSLIDVEGITFLHKNYNNINYWGAFTHKFDLKHPLLKFTSFWSNNVRGDLRHIFYLDHCIFAPQSHFQKIGDIPDVDIFEDTILSKKLNKVSAPIRLPNLSTTSAVRFKSNGIFRQSLLNQKLKWKYYFNKDSKLMNESYEKNLDLNSAYEKKNYNKESKHEHS